jgi:hypothetical protein
VWHGFVPPPFRDINASTRSWVSVPYCCAVAAMFLGPVLLAVGRRPSVPARNWAWAAALAAAPALVFPSAATVAPDDARRGGLIWSIVAHGPSVMDRSLVLAALGALGAWVVCQLVVLLPRPVGVLLTAGLTALAATLWAGEQLHQKYFELPIAALTVIVVCALIASGRPIRRWPLIALGVAQLILTAGIVAKPFLAGLFA